MIKHLLHRSRTGRPRNINITSPSKNKNTAAKCILELTTFEKETRSSNFASDFDRQRAILESLRELGNNMFEYAHKKTVLKEFLSLGGTMILVDLTVALSKHVKSGTIGYAGKKGPKYGVGITHLLNELCSCLRELMYDFPNLADVSLVGSIEFVTHICHYLLGVNNCDTAAVLLEEIVAYRSTTFLLSDIQNFDQIAMTLSSRQLALFFRIFAILIFEPENKENKKDTETHSTSIDSDDGEINIQTDNETKTKHGNMQTSPQSPQSPQSEPLQSEPLQSPQPLSSTSSPISSTSSPNSKKSTTNTSTSSTNTSTYQKLPKTLKLLCPASWKRRKTIQIIDQNHAYVLGIPGFMKRMCRLLERISRKTFPSQSSISPTAGQATPSTRTHTPQEQHMDHMAAALRAALMENPAEEDGMDELAFMLGLPRESLLVSISKRRRACIAYMESTCS